MTNDLPKVGAVLQEDGREWIVSALAQDAEGNKAVVLKPLRAHENDDT